MQFEELRFVCQEAAKDHAEQGPRPLVPAIVLPGPERTRIVRLPDFPADDEARHAFVQQFAKDEVEKNLVPCWGFLAEANLEDGTDVVVAVYGARRHAPAISAAPIAEDGSLGEFLPDEQLDPTAMPFLHPLQHTVDAMSDVVDAPTPIDGVIQGGPASRSGLGSAEGRQLPDDDTRHLPLI